MISLTTLSPVWRNYKRNTYLLNYSLRSACLLTVKGVGFTSGDGDTVWPVKIYYALSECKSFESSMTDSVTSCDNKLKTLNQIFKSKHIL